MPTKSGTPGPASPPFSAGTAPRSASGSPQGVAGGTVEEPAAAAEASRFSATNEQAMGELETTPFAGSGLRRSTRLKAITIDGEEQKNEATSGRKRARASAMDGSGLSEAKPDVKVGGRKAAKRLETRFLGEPVSEEEAKQRWPDRYGGKKHMHAVSSASSKRKDDSEEIIQARCHYIQALVDGKILFNLNDDAHVKAENGAEPYICRIVEMFESLDGKPYFTAQWYYRANDTVIKDHSSLIDKKRVFFSDVRDDNPLECLVKKINIIRVDLNNKASIPRCDYYCDMTYLLPYSTFIKLELENGGASSEGSSTISTDIVMGGSTGGLKCEPEMVPLVKGQPKNEVTLLDLYAGCGAMSTGLCLGANLSNLNLVTRWAVDLNKYACESLRLNHPETEVRNEAAEDFLMLLKEWDMLCVLFGLVKGDNPHPFVFEDDGDDDSGSDEGSDSEESNDSDESDVEDEGKIFEVEKILAICYGDPREKDEPGLWFKVRWKGYGDDCDSWEPLEGLRNCREAVKSFVTDGYQRKILPLPGDVDVICGGPPCQGISGLNRFRDVEDPLRDVRNKQLIIFMDIVKFLRPRFVLMENVVDLVRFAGGFLGKYAIGRLVGMDYQARMGLMAAGAYGLPQFRMRVFVWGASPAEKLPQYPLPTHDVVIRGNFPVEFENNVVAYDEGQDLQLEEKLLLKDAISDLPSIGNNENRDEMPYDKPPETDFQRQIRMSKDKLMSSFGAKKQKQMLYDHRPIELNEDDYERVCQIPKKKGANFRDLRGVIVKPGNKVAFDPKIKRVYLKSGKPLVPDYAMQFVGGTSLRPFGRLWWDETVPTVVTRAFPHNQVILHPEQDRVLSIRENARLQGFPDFYRLCGSVKERYVQVGNAVAVPVARALGYALAQAFQGLSNEEPLMKLPPRFPNIQESASSEDAA